jgi:hypothetical protein
LGIDEKESTDKDDHVTTKHQRPLPLCSSTSHRSQSSW